MGACYSPITEEDKEEGEAIQVDEYDECCDYITIQNNLAAQHCTEPALAVSNNKANQPTSKGGGGGSGGMIQQKMIEEDASPEPTPLTKNEMAQIMTGKTGGGGRGGTTGPSGTGLIGICETFREGYPCEPEPDTVDCPPVGSQENSFASSPETPGDPIPQYILDFLSQLATEEAAEACAPLV